MSVSDVCGLPVFSLPLPSRVIMWCILYRFPGVCFRCGCKLCVWPSCFLIATAVAPRKVPVYPEAYLQLAGRPLQVYTGGGPGRGPSRRIQPRWGNEKQCQKMLKFFLSLYIVNNMAADYLAMLRSRVSVAVILLLFIQIHPDLIPSSLTCQTWTKNYIFLHARPWIPGDEIAIFTAVIH